MTVASRTNDQSLKALSNSDANAKTRIGNSSGIDDKENTPLLDANRCLVNDDATSTTKSAAATAAATAEKEFATTIFARPREVLAKEISRQVLRHKLQKLRHLVVEGAISKDYLDHSIFHPKLLDLFAPQSVVYNGGIANVKEWKISCYLEVMEGGIPCTNPHLELLEVFRPLLDTCDDLFMMWYKQQHACNSRRNKNKSNSNNNNNGSTKRKCQRLMTFVTRYTPAPGEQALLKHVDGAGKVDGSCVVALPVDRWTAPEAENSWHGHGGGLTFWDGKEAVPDTDESKSDNNEKTDNRHAPQRQRRQRYRPREIHYETRSGDVAFIDRAVWHQADPITKGTRWALVIFYKVTEEDDDDKVERKGNKEQPNN
jgi:hypothetical protein